MKRTRMCRQLDQSGVLLFAALASGLWTGCGAESDAEIEPPEPPRPVRVEQVAAVRVEAELRTSGIVEARSRIPLAFRVSGFVAEFAADEGDRVEKGGVIAWLDKSDVGRDVAVAQAGRTSAAAHAAEAKREYERQQSLLETNSTSSQRHQQAKSAYEMAVAASQQARLRLDSAREDLDDSTLIAPLTGYIEKRLLEPHQFTAAELPAVIFADLDSVKVRGSVPDRDLSRLEVGDVAIVRSRAWPEREFEGKVSHVAVAADPTVRTVPFEVTLDNSDLALRSAMVVEVVVRTGESEALVLAPLGAVVRDANLDTLVFVISGEGDEQRAVKRIVELGRLHGDRVVILRGVRPGEQMVVQGQYFLKDGDPIRIVDRAS